MIAGFVQDSWQLGRRLTMNYGLRYDLDRPVEYWKTGTPFGKTDYNNFGPRLALSYDLTGVGHTFVKVSSGVFYDRIWGNDSLNMFIFKDAPQRTRRRGRRLPRARRSSRTSSRHRPPRFLARRSTR